MTVTGFFWWVEEMGHRREQSWVSRWRTARRVASFQGVNQQPLLTKGLINARCKGERRVRFAVARIRERRWSWPVGTKVCAICGVTLASSLPIRAPGETLNGDSCVNG